jgi:hypothetical protein
MPYYPKNRIQTNLYTSGDEFVIKTTSSPYQGYYYKLYNGETYTGKTPNDGTPQLLISSLSIVSDKTDDSLFNTTNPELPSTVLDYLNTLSQQPEDKKLPTPYYPDPNIQDYKLGEITRYFARKINEPLFIEINKTDYNNLKQHNPQYFWEMYLVEALPWDITGNKDQVTTTNKKLVELIEYKSKWYGFTKYIALNGGFTKFYK